jgi:hypothetical protein
MGLYFHGIIFALNLLMGSVNGRDERAVEYGSTIDKVVAMN